MENSSRNPRRLREDGMRDEPGPIRIGIIDGPVSHSGMEISDQRVFCDRHGTPSGAPGLQHGNGVTRAISRACPGADLYCAQVFSDKLVCTPHQVAEALNWLVAQGVHFVNMSFGLRRDRPVLRDACEQALASGVCLVAAAPAQGAGVFPSLYPGVVRATGDARCAPGQVSWLDSEQADFGGHPGAPGDPFAGASAGCAAVTAALAALALRQGDLRIPELLRELRASADYRGPECRSIEDQPV
jgi:hypothetical protein